MLKTKSGLPKHCYWQRDRHGTDRVRFRRAGVSIYLTGTPWSEEFMRQYAIALDLAQAPSAYGASQANSIDALVASYYKLVFPTLKPSTQAMRRNILKRFCAEFGRDQVGNFERKHIAAIIANKTATPHAGNNLRKVLRHLFEHAIDVNLIAHNPVVGTKRLKTSGDGRHSWTDDEIARYRAHWPLGTQERLCFELALETTSRRADVSMIGPQHRRGDVLDLRHTKNNAEAFIPLTDELRAAIDACPTKHLTYLHTKNGTPRSAKALGGDFRRWCDLAGLPKRCSIHGLRKGGARRLAEAGASAREIMSITGHKTLSEVQRYTDAVDKARLAKQAIAKLSKSGGKNQFP